MNQSVDTGKIALEVLGSATYSDMKMGANLVAYYDIMMNGNLANISGIKYVNHRFYLNAITSFKYYKNIFKFTHSYDASFLFNLTVKSLNSSIVFARPVLIDRKLIKSDLLLFSFKNNFIVFRLLLC